MELYAKATALVDVASEFQTADLPLAFVILAAVTLGVVRLWWNPPEKTE